MNLECIVSLGSNDSLDLLHSSSLYGYVWHCGIELHAHTHSNPMHLIVKFKITSTENESGKECAPCSPIKAIQPQKVSIHLKVLQVFNECHCQCTLYIVLQSHCTMSSWRVNANGNHLSVWTQYTCNSKFQVHLWIASRIRKIKLTGCQPHSREKLCMRSFRCCFTRIQHVSFICSASRRMALSSQRDAKAFKRSSPQARCFCCYYSKISSCQWKFSQSNHNFR